MKFLIFVTSGIYFIACLFAIMTEFRFLKITSFAVYSEISEIPFSNYHVTAENLMRTSPRSCRRDIRTSRATIAVNAYQLIENELNNKQKNNSGKFEKLINQHDKYLYRARDELLYSLNCTPFDGSAWLRLAWLVKERKILYNNLSFEKLIDSSVFMSPLEYWKIVGRILIISEIISTTDTELQNYIVRDLFNLINLGEVKDIVNILKQISEIPLSISEDILRNIPNNKKDEIISEYYK